MSDGGTDDAFREMVARLTASDRVAGLVTVGSTAYGRRGNHSDYDILVLLHDSDVAIATGTAWADGTLVDLIFLTLDELQAATASEPLSPGTDWQQRVVRWVCSGEVVLDRTGAIAMARESSSQLWHPPIEDSELLARWDHDSYNLAQNRRYANSEDATYQRAFHLRLTYSLADLMLNYFGVRALRWIGEKDAVRYWQQNDAEYWACFDACLHESDTAKRWDAYEKLTIRTWAPFRNPWTTGHVSIVPTARGAASVEDWTRAQAFWADLMGAG